MNPKPIVVCKDLCKAYGEGANATHALRGVNLTVHEGELRLLMGPSGSGKTTLISIIAAILTQSSGECFVNGLNLNHLPDDQKTLYRGHHIGFVFQIFNLIPMISVEENIAIPLFLQNVPRSIALQKAKDLLKDLGMEDKIGTYPKELSGGQQQRVAIARALIHNPKLILCDEPTSFLDHDTGNKIMELLRHLVKTMAMSCIVVTHDLRIKDFADQIDYLEDGKIVNPATIAG